MMQNPVTRNGAWWVSMVLNPLIVPPLLFTIVARANGVSNTDIWTIFLTSVLLYCVTPLVYLLVLLKLKAIDSIEARNQTKRQNPLYWGVLWLSVAIPIMIWVSSGNSSVFGLISGMFALNIFIIATINRSLKISIHVAGVSGFLSILIMLQLTHLVSSNVLSVPLVAAGIASILSVGWARWQSKAHQMTEIEWGAVFGIAAPALEIFLFTLFGG